ncbi:hypothetical protein SLEP1_g2207 [Rubroshorea leprosula]|uniref:Uncharacterized protein n=1 Tax=Rubroshorea leprosula TaxID=152421 RepID=A0AAV5HQW1_9ROSI|nr:hypothetical protein SLEP1_g2207 [Rubroshorea leprosula]
MASEDTTTKANPKTTGGAREALKSGDPDSPYYLHPSDDPGRILVTSPLIGENYHTWKRALQNALYAKNKMGSIDGTLRRPEIDSPNYASWKKCNSMVLSWILNTISKELHDSVAYVDSARKVWNDLQERFSQGNTTRVHELKLELATMVQQDRSVAAYFTKLKPIWDELHAYEPTPVCVCGCTYGVAKEYTKARETEKVHQFLMGLNDNFSTIRSQILNLEPLPSLNKVYAMATKEERQQAITASRGPVIEDTALVARSSMSGRLNNPGKAWCDHCKKVGHTKDRCYKIIGYPSSWKTGGTKTKGKGDGQRSQSHGRELIFAAKANHDPTRTDGNQNQSPLAGLTKEQYDQLLTLLGGNSITNHSTNMVGKMQISSFPWIIDSGASDHMTPNLSRLIETIPYFAPVHIPDGTSLHVSHIGKAKLAQDLTLDNDLTSRKLIGMGKLHEGIYYCEFGHVAAASRVKPKETASFELWHKRLVSKDFTQAVAPYPNAVGLIFEEPTQPIETLPSIELVSLTQDEQTITTNQSIETSVQNMGPEVPQSTRPQRQRHAPKRFQDNVCDMPPSIDSQHIPFHSANSGILYPFSHHLSYDSFSRKHSTYLAAITSIDEPKSFYQAIKNEKWREAMRKEITALEQNGTWTLEQLPAGKKVIDFKWVYKIKYKPDGTVERYKARLVAKGFTQVEGLDYHETYAPVAKLVTIRLLLAIAAIKHWELHQLDVKNAFLQGDLHEEVYMKIPQGFTWNDTARIQALKQYLHTRFSIKDLGPLKYFLGIEVIRTREGIVLSQRKYALDILHEIGVIGARPSHSPMEQNHHLSSATRPLHTDPAQYRRLIGRLLYLTITRPDICYSVGLLTQFMQNPRQEHHEAAMRVLRYIKGSPGQGILLPSVGPLTLTTYCDADWAGCPITRRSTTGYFISLGNSPISWKSNKQAIVSRSSAEAEYRAMAMTLSELIWLKSLLSDLCIPHEQPMTLYCDNQAAIHIANNPVFHERTKHIEIDCHFIRERLQAGELVTRHVMSKQQPTDIFTKALGREHFASLLSKLGIRDVHAPT